MKRVAFLVSLALAGHAQADTSQYTCHCVCQGVTTTSTTLLPTTTSTSSTTMPATVVAMGNLSGPNLDTAAGDRVRVAGPFPLSSASWLTRFCMPLQGAAQPQQMRFVIYSDAAGNPDMLLWYSAPLTLAANAPKREICDDGTQPVPQLPGGVYHLGVDASVPTGGHFFTESGGSYVAKWHAFADGPPKVWGTPEARQSGRIAAYVLGTPWGIP